MQTKMLSNLRKGKGEKAELAGRHLCTGLNAGIVRKYLIYDWVIDHFHTTSY